MDIPGRNCCEVVAPFAGAWIEILQKLIINVSNASLPSRERGLKSNNSRTEALSCIVAPFAGAWIEMMKNNFEFGLFMVAPFVGVRIEISGTEVTEMSCSVAPFMGA